MSSLLPSRDSQAVPVNTLVWIIRERGCTYSTLADARGATVPTTRRTFEPNVAVLDPLDDLVLGETYTVLCGRRPLGVFTVSLPADSSPPPTPLVTLGEHVEHETNCGPYGTVGLDVKGPVNDQVFILDVGDEARFDAARLSGSALDVFAPTDLPHVGTSWACQDENWSLERRGDASRTRLMAVDLAGNASPWSEPKAVSASCSVRRAIGEGAPNAALFVCLGLLALALRRARR